MPDSSAHTHMHYNKRPRIHLGRWVDKQAVNTYILASGANLHMVESHAV